MGVGGERRGRVHLDEPGLEIVVDEHVVAVELKALLVIYDDVLNAEQGPDDDVLDVGIQPIGRLEAVARYDVQLELLDIPLAAVGLVVAV